MTTTLAPPRVTVDEYFALEMATEFPNEYRAGEVVQIDETEIEIGLIKVSLVVAMDAPSHDHRFQPLLGFRVRIPEVDAYLYPDVSVFVGKARVESRGDMDTLLNPVLVMDVASERPSHADPEWRAAAYRALETIREYVRVASDRPYVEVYRRGEDGAWGLAEARQGLEGNITLASIGVTMAMATVYSQIREFIADTGPNPQ